MKIKTRLRLNTLISLCVVILIVLSLVWSLREVVIAERKRDIVYDMRKVAFERILLRDEYILYQEKRAETQWYAKSEDLRDLLALAGTVFGQEKDKSLLQDARTDFDATFTGFSRIMKDHAIRERAAKKTVGFSEAESRLINQIFLKDYSLTDNINRLHESAQKTATRARDGGAFIVVFSILVGIIAIIINSIVIGRTLAKRMTALSEGVDIIGAGDLDHRIAVEGDDELSALARANNEMAAKLSRSYTSVENLQKEVGERKQAEELLREQSVWLRDAQRVGRIGSYALDLQAGTWTSSDILDDIFGISRDAEKTVASWDALVHPDEREEMLQYFMHSVVAEKKPFNREYRIVRGHDGEVRWMWGLGELSFDSDGTLVKMIGVIQDITERKRADNEIRKLNEELEQRVKDRTARFEVANKELEAFSYSVSHDLRAPLRHMAGFVGLLNKRTQSLDDKSRHYLDVISNAATQMGKLVDDLLSFSRMGRTEMMRSPVGLRDPLDEAINDLKNDAGGRDIRWDIKDLPEVLGDRAMLKLVFVNLLSNALKFTRQREQVVIEIGWLPAEAPDEIIVYVKDNGAGFDMKYVDKLFNLFQRLHRSEDFEGTGVGLANVRRIISRHGGRTWAEGVIDGGATVFFSFPRK